MAIWVQNSESDCKYAVSTSQEAGAGTGAGTGAKADTRACARACDRVRATDVAIAGARQDGARRGGGKGADAAAVTSGGNAFATTKASA
jgi:hypothetical protein